jgi:hypothetical protein
MFFLELELGDGGCKQQGTTGFSEAILATYWTKKAG